MSWEEPVKTEVVSVIVRCAPCTWLVWGQCEFPSKNFPSGFEFSFPSLKAARLERCDPRDIGLTTYSPDSDGPWVIVRVDAPSQLSGEAAAAYRNRLSDDGELRVPLAKCQHWLGVSQWVLIDLLAQQKADELQDAVQACLADRNYKVETTTLSGGRLRTTTEVIEG